MEQRHIALLINDAARAFRSAFEQRGREQKVSLLQWRTLAVLSRRDGLSQTALAQEVEASAMTVSDILDRLEARGWVRRDPDPADSRAKLVRLLPAAMPIATELRQRAQELSARAFDGISPDEVETLTRLLSRIVANLDTDSTPKA